MKSARFIFFTLIILVMVISIFACVGGGGGGGGGSGTPQPEVLLGDDITATFGASLFHQQLTAIARDRVTPAAQQP